MRLGLNNLIITTAIITIAGCGGGGSLNGQARATTAYFGDKANNKIDVVDVENMELKEEIYTGHQKTYAAEVIKIHNQGHSSDKKMYIDNRGSDAIDVMQSSSNSITKTINLPFHPRSIDVEEETGLVAVSGTDKPMVKLIEY